MPCKYHAAEDVYTDDLAYFSADDTDREKFLRLKIPINGIVHLGSIEELPQLMHTMAFEFYFANAYNNEVMEHYTEILLLKLSRIIESGIGNSSAALAEKNYRLTQIRNLIHTMPENIPNIDSMAKGAGMSRSSFQHLYKKCLASV